MNALLSEMWKKNELWGREMIEWKKSKKKKVSLSLCFCLAAQERDQTGSNGPGRHRGVALCCNPSICSQPGRARSPALS